MDLIKAMMLGAIISVTIALVIGNQGTSGGALAIQSVLLADMKLYWSWPIFFSTSGVFFGLMLLQR